MPEYVGHAVAHVDVRPKRAAYLYPSRSVAGFLAAVERACSRWGGVNEAVIPVSAKGAIRPAWRQVIELLRPDTLFHIGPMTVPAANRVRQDVGLSPVPVAREDHPMYGMHVLNVHEPTGTPRVVITPAERTAATMAGAGALASWDPVDAWTRAGFDVKTAQTSVDLALAQLERRTVIENTAAQVSEVLATNLPGLPPVLWVYARSNLRDAMWFWNVRALMLRSFYGGAALVSLSTARDPLFAQQLSAWLAGRKRVTSPDVIVHSLTVKDPVLQCLIDTLGLDRHPTESLTFHFGEDAEGPYTATTQVDPLRYLRRHRVPGMRAATMVVVERPITTIRGPSPVRFDFASGHVKLTISGMPFLDVPRRDAVASLIHRDSVWADGGLQLETNASPTYQFSLHPPLPSDVLEAVLRKATRQVTVSQPGRLADSVLRLHDDPTLYADPMVHDVIGALTTPRSRSLVTELAAQLPTNVPHETIESIAQRMGTAARRIDLTLEGIASRIASNVGETSRVVEQLVRASLVARGWRSECDRCGLRSFVPVTETTSLSACGECGAPASYASGTKTVEPTPHYQLHALVDRASDQGVLCHLYAWANLRRRAPSQMHILLGADVVWTDGTTSEADLVGFMDTDVFAGEAKMTAGWFSTEQVARDVHISARLGVDTHVMACLRPLPEAAVRAAASEAERHSLRLLTIAPP